MFYNSLNSYNLRISQDEGALYSYRKYAAFPASIVLALVCLPFAAVLNDNLFQLYYYDGYGFSIACFGSIVAVFLYFLITSHKIPIQSFKALIYMIIAVAYCVVSAVIVKGGYRYIGVVMNTMGTVVVLSHCKLRKRTISLVFAILILTGLYCALTVNGYYEIQIRGESVNSNYVALFGVIILVYGNAFLSYLRKKETLIIQLIRIALAALSFYIIWECQSRGSLLTWVFYLVCVYVLPYSLFRSKKVVTWTVISIAIFGVLFTYVYITNLTNIISTFMGKSTATRFRLWSYFWNTIFNSSKNMVFGYGTHSELRDVFGYGLHNIYIGIWYDIGIIGLFMFVVFIVFSMRKTYENITKLSIPQLYVVVGFLSLMISDLFAITFTGPMVIWNYALLGMARTAKLE